MERRIVSVLFADLVSFTTLSERLDPEDVATIQGAYFAAVRETIARYGGRIEKFIGDAAMAVFGIPRGRDDDAERAVRAALAVVSAVEQVGAQLGLDRDVLRVRVGVHTGEVVAAAPADDGALVSGDTVNVAARLQSAAPPGGVLVGDATALAVAAAVDLATPEALPLKGKAEPVRAVRVIGVRAHPSREHAMGALRAPTVGREGDLEVLRTAVGTGGRVLVVAPPGAGKTRLVNELAHIGQWPVWFARLRADVLGPNEPVAQLLAAAIDGVGAPAAAVEQALLRSGASPDRAAAVTAATMRVLQPSPAETDAVVRDRDALFAAWLEVLRALGGASALWVVEDVHWAGGDLLAFLDAAIATASARLVVATARPVILEQAAGWSAAGPRRKTVQLAGLGPAAIRDLVHALVGDALSEALVAAVVDRSDGNPLFVEELLRTWVSVGVLVPAGGAWRMTVDDARVPIPATVQAVYAAQLDDLPPAARAMARGASVAGRRFPASAIDVLGGAAAREGLEALLRRALVTGPSDEGTLGPRYAFRHALLRDAAYASLARSDRASLHVRYARWLEAAAAGHGDDVAESVARSYDAAASEAPALTRELAPGLARDACVQAAADWYERAGSIALRLTAHEAARALLGRCIELTPPESAVALARRWRLRGEATAFAADIAEGAASYRRSLDHARAALAGPGAEAARDEAARAFLALGFVLVEQLRFDDALALADGALRELGDRDDAASARVLLLRGVAAEGISNAGSAGALLADRQRTIAIARRRGDAALALEAACWHVAHHIPNPHVLPDAAEVDALIADATREGAWAMVSALFEAKAMKSLFAGRLDDVPALADRSEQVARARGFGEGVCWADYVRCELGLHAGRWDDAIAAGVRALDAAEARGYHRAAIRTWMAVTPMASARRDEALLRRLHAWYVPRRPLLPRSPFALMEYAAFERWLAAADLLPVQDVPVEACAASWGVEFRQPSWFAAAEELLLGWLRAGHVDAARRGVETYGSTLRTWSSPLARAVGALFHAHIARAVGDDVTPHACVALDDARRAGAPWWEAKALRMAGEDAQASAIEVRLGVR